MFSFVSTDRTSWTLGQKMLQFRITYISVTNEKISKINANNVFPSYAKFETFFTSYCFMRIMMNHSQNFTQKQ